MDFLTLRECIKAEQITQFVFRDSIILRLNGLVDILHERALQGQGSDDQLTIGRQTVREAMIS
jgi:hypothetical protein